MANFLFNKLPTDIQLKNPKQLTKYLKSSISTYFPFDRILKYDHG